MKKYMIYSVVFLISATLFYGCGGGVSDETPTVKSSTYATTSTRGDYTEWTLTGNTLSAVWQVVNGMGGIDYTHTFDATCGPEASTGLRECTFGTVTCADGLSACPPVPTGSFSMMHVPDVAIFVHTGTGVSSQLHIGFLKDDTACTQDVSGDYVSMHIGLGKRDIFGMYRSDTNFIDILHSDFGFTTTDSNMHQTLSYNTGTEAATLVNNGCTDGVRFRDIGGSSLRSMMTRSGLFVLDLPAGEGGILSFKVANVATLSDIANKSFGGYTFPDDDDPEAITVTSGAVTSNRIALTATLSSGIDNLRIMHLGTTDSMITPAYPDFSGLPTGYSVSTLSSTYTSAESIPGLYKLDGLNDSGRVILSGMKHNNKVILLGMVYNYRDTGDINPSTSANFSEDGLYNTGNFILFER